MLIEGFEKDLALLINAALVAREAATHEESRSEDKHDTRGLEASYLAGGQARRAQELEELIHFYKALPVSDLKKGEALTAPALVELEIDEKEESFFLIPKGSSGKVEVKGKTLQIVTAQSPLGAELLGRECGEEFNLKVGPKQRTYRILSYT